MTTRNLGMVTLGAVLALSACGSSGNRSVDAGGGAGGNSTGAGGIGGTTGAGGSAGATTSGGGGGVGGAGQVCVIDGAAADWFAGTWTGLQANTTYVVTNKDGCSSWTGTVNGVVCDVCTGTYTLSAAPGTGMVTLACEPKASCSVSPAHMDVGTVTFTGCTFVYDYTFTGGGSSSFTGATRTGDAPASVCSTGLVH